MTEGSAGRGCAGAGLDRALGRSVEEVFAKMIPLGLAPARSAGPAQLACRVDIRGTWEGTVRLLFTRASAELLARSMLRLGAREPLSEEALVDALGECVNLVAGRFKHLALDGVPGARSSLPWVERAGAARAGAVRCSRAWRFEGGALAAELSVTSSGRRAG